jgi:hypothetical protein
VLLGLLLLCAPSDAVEGYLADPGGAPRLVAAATPGWTLDLSLHLWAAGVKGNVAAKGMTVPVDVSFDELFDDLNAALMARLDARTGPWGVHIDMEWVSLEQTTAGSLGSPVTVEQALFIAELSGSREFLRRGGFALGGYAGLRLCATDTEITSVGPAAEGSESWVDPVVGLEGRYVAGRWVCGARGDVGGFGLGSEIAWSVTIGVRYRFTDLFSLAAGYRWLDIDFGDSGSVLDARMAGPFLALVFRF